MKNNGFSLSADFAARNDVTEDEEPEVLYYNDAGDPVYARTKANKPKIMYYNDAGFPVYNKVAGSDDDAFLLTQFPGGINLNVHQDVDSTSAEPEGESEINESRRT